MIRVTQINGGAGILAVLTFCVLLHLPPLATALRMQLPEEESKSLWHQMADSMLFVEERDRDRFLDLCLRRRVFCDDTRFSGGNATFQWRTGVSHANKDRFWRSYKCSYERDITLCPVDGGWSAWSPWSRCSATCDAKGNQTRSRTCTNPVPMRGGERCHGSLIRTRPCLGLCDEPTSEGGLAEAEAYLRQVHEHYPDLLHDCFDSHCTFGVVQRAIEQKHVRTKYWSSLNCVKYGGACPVDGDWGGWSVWSTCSMHCGAGFRTRTRLCDRPNPQFGGHPCTGDFVEQQSCIMRDCGPTTTETFTEWTKWSPCSVSCGTYGVQSSTRVCLRKAGCDLNGILTPFINRSRPCYPGDCPSAGGWSEWSEFADCSAACGDGRQSRLRMCDSPYPTGGMYCQGEPIEFRFCKGENCVGQEVPPEVRARTVVEEDEEEVVILSNHGQVEIVEEVKKIVEVQLPPATESPDKEPKEMTSLEGFTKLMPKFMDEVVLIGKNDEFLNGPMNPELEEIYSPWTSWTKCSSSCGQGTRQRHRWCKDESNPLPPCTGEVRQIQFCNVYVCPLNGGWGNWLPWSPCSKTCAVGKQQRYRECNNPLPQFGGTCDGDSMRVETCDMGVCPKLPGGTWSAWSSWTLCTAPCGGGERLRHRTKHRHPDQPAVLVVISNGEGSKTSVSSDFPPFDDEGSKETLTCNLQPCPVDGSWADWGEWTRCNVQCGLGRRTRDRTCTDPAPIFGGEVCNGPGSDLAHCFAGPCKDSEDRAVLLGPTSWMRFAPRNRPTRFLVLYVHFKPTSPTGQLIRRYRPCHSIFDDQDEDQDVEVEEGDKKSSAEDKYADSDEKCQIIVDLRLDQSQVCLSVAARDATLDINSPVVLSLGAWHEVMVEVLKSGASMRVNDHERVYVNFSRPLIRDLDFDSHMSIGSHDNISASFEGAVAAVSVNFRHTDLFAATDWEGQGVPVGRHAVSVQSTNPSVQLPHFRGLYYSPLHMRPTEKLAIRVTLALDDGEGLLLYVRGQKEGTLFSLGFKKSRLVVCMVCSPATGNVCKHGDLLRLHQWYHVAVTVESIESEVRVDQGKALQLTCKGEPFRPREVLYVGGRSIMVWDDVQKETNYTEGFFGVLGTIVLNEMTIPFRRVVLMSRQNRLNPDGYSRATRITPVFEHRTSVVTLHCDVANPRDPATEIKVIWLLSDAVMEPNDYIEITKPVGMDKQTGTLQLRPGGNNEGIYACVVSRDGRLELNHVFPVFRHAAAADTSEGAWEWFLLKLFLFLIPFLALMLIAWKFRDWLMDLCNRLCGDICGRKKGLPTTSLRLFMPDDPHLHGADSKGSWDNYLGDTGEMKIIDVVHFGPAQPRVLSNTPGTVSDRALEVSGGQLLLGEQPFVSSGNAEAHFDSNAQRALTSMQSAPVNRPPPAPYQNLELAGESYYQEYPDFNEDAKVNRSHNRSPPPGKMVLAGIEFGAGDRGKRKASTPFPAVKSKEKNAQRKSSAAMPHAGQGDRPRRGSLPTTFHPQHADSRRLSRKMSLSEPVSRQRAGSQPRMSSTRRTSNPPRPDSYPSARSPRSRRQNRRLSGAMDGHPGRRHDNPQIAKAMKYQKELEHIRGTSRDRTNRRRSSPHDTAARMNRRRSSPPNNKRPSTSGVARKTSPAGGTSMQRKTSAAAGTKKSSAAAGAERVRRTSSPANGARRRSSPANGAERVRRRSSPANGPERVRRTSSPATGAARVRKRSSPANGVRRTSSPANGPERVRRRSSPGNGPERVRRRSSPANGAERVRRTSSPASGAARMRRRSSPAIGAERMHKTTSPANGAPRVRRRSSPAALGAQGVNRSAHAGGSQKRGRRSSPVGAIERLNIVRMQSPNRLMRSPRSRSRSASRRYRRPSSNRNASALDPDDTTTTTTSDQGSSSDPPSMVLLTSPLSVLDSDSSSDNS